MNGTITRRSTLRGLAVVVVAGVVGFVLARTSDAASETTGSAAANGYGPATADDGKALASLNDVPDGGGLVLGDQHVVLTRQGGTVHAFSATCTHQGCTVDRVADGVISCPCHGSTFDASTGQVVGGPAPQPLAPVPIEVTGDQITRAAGG